MKSLKVLLLLLLSHWSFGQVNCITTPDQLGPYFVAGAPKIINDTLVPGIINPSRALELTFYVSYDCDTVNLDTLPSTYTIQLWHTNDAGAYSNVGGNPNSFDYRGELELTGYSTTLHTTLPGIYPNRPAHIHIKGFLNNAWFTDTLVTQLYFQGDSLIPFDVASNMPERWIYLDTLQNGGYKGAFAFGLSYLVDIKEEKGAIENVYPNPTTGEIKITMKSADDLKIYDSLGQLMVEQRVYQGDNHLSLQHLPRGIYFLRSNSQVFKITLN